MRKSWRFFASDCFASSLNLGRCLSVYWRDLAAPSLLFAMGIVQLAT
jgi:hypothetical protein